ncbi:hypothetical protein ACFLQX_01555 [Bacteroidota bacterium]
MKRTLIIISLFLISVSFTGFSQSSATISKPELVLNENQISIHYDILNCGQSEKFNISLEVVDDKGIPIVAHSLSGDIGNNIRGGSGKMISWDLASDNLYLETMLYFQVNATASSPEISSTADRSTEPKVRKESGSLSRGSVVVQSLLMPGLGLSRVKGKPHWIKGVLGYACIGSSVAFNISSSNKYDEYTQTTDITVRDDLFEVSANHKNISRIQLFSAIGIWTVDFIWTLAGSKDLSRKFADNQMKGISIEPSFDTRENVPLLTLKYNF